MLSLKYKFGLIILGIILISEKLVSSQWQEQPINCYNCEGSACTSQLGNISICSGDIEQSCVTVFSEDVSSVIARGCSEKIAAKYDSYCERNSDKCHICSSNGCNVAKSLSKYVTNFFDQIPQESRCKVCNSKDDENCAINPTQVGQSVTCSMPYSQCYSMVSDGNIIRGCVNELSDDSFYQCLINGGKNCQACSGDNCNVKVFAEDQLSCHECNSLDDPNCQDNPNSPIVCSENSENEICTTKLVDGVTYRGCGSDFTCDDSDKQYCKMCNSSNCNVVNLYQNNIGYPGNWQDLPINCYTCNGQECESSSTTLLRKCENNNLQNCVTVFDAAGKVVQRGCSDTIYEGPYDQHCDQHSDLCTYCKSSGCNDASNLNEYVDCLFCDSASNFNCTSNVAVLSKTRKCKGKCMTSLYPRSDDSDPALEISRSCFDDKELDDRTECESGNDQFCKVCQGSKCNVDELPDKRLSCIRCTGDECESDFVETICPAYRENDLCIILFDSENNIAQMGCKSDFDSAALNLLRKRMLFCKGDNCNDFDLIPNARKCLQCNSAENPLCATKPDSLTNFNNCNKFPYTECFTSIEDGQTVRGCLADLELETFEMCLESSDDIKCNVCSEETCNNQIYPEDRQICLRCSSEDDEFCQSTPVDSSACPIYQKEDQCGVAIIGETTNRGCSSELNCNGEDRETCRLCSSNNCNTVDLLSNYIGKPGQWQDLPLNCYTCEGPACQTSNGILKMCSNNNLQKCETVFNETGVVVRRGCSDDVATTHGDYCDTNSGHCQQCKSSGCNNVKNLIEYVDCAFCDSSTNTNCVLNPNEVIKTRKCNKECMVALFPRSSEEDPSYELLRTCLDDKDLDDRQECLDGKEPYCNACSGLRCNTFEFPIDRHECYVCRGEECTDAKVQKCVSYHPTDQCYILFDNTSSLIAMGCRSEYEHVAVTDLIQSKQLLLCKGMNCNSYDSIPQAQSCIVCNSATDPRCATNPNLIVESTSCSQLPYTGCYTIINNDGDTERGCQSDLESTAFYGCHTESNTACSTCSGNKCNKAVFPANRTTCHRCNSLDDGEKCASSPISNGVCPKFTDDESCVTSYINGITYRGCSSELSCDESDKKTCRVCSGSACNTVNLEYVAKDGEPGKWQDLPIKCQTCKGDNCKNSPVPVESCLNNNLQNCMTVFNELEEVIQRGCSDSVNEDQEAYCEQNNNRCFRCNSNECNKATSPNDYIECLSCDTSTNSSCVTDSESWKNTRMCYKGCMTALYPKSTEDDPAYATIRTCLDDKEFADQQTCAAGTEELCKSCEDKNCNTGSFPIDRRSCFHCSGDDCQNPEIKLCSGYRANDQCSLLLDDERSIIEAGCKSDFTIDQAVALIKAKRLFLCDGDNCNKDESLPTSQSCSLCNSKTDPKCAIEPNAVNSNTNCNRVPYTQCYTRVLSDGATERGCLSNLEGNDFYDCLIGNATTCKSCSGEQCNNKIYPVGRASCQICDSESDPNCHANPNSLSICPKYAKDDSCVTSFSAGTTYRGCESDIQCDVYDRKKCRICSADGCNTVNLEQKQDDNYGKWQDLPLECYECTGSECNGPLGEAKQCHNNNEQDCSMVYNSDGKVIRRGCSDEVDEEFEDYCDVNPGLCFNCKSNRCNTETALSEFNECIYCDSSKDISCVTSPESSHKTRKCNSKCMTALYPSDSSSDPAYELIRTCLNDKEKGDQDNCKGDMCKSCVGDSCNIDVIPTDRLQCHSCKDESCEEPVSQLCPLYKKDDKCYIRFDSSNSIVEMGCLSAFRTQEVVDILKTKRVYICNGENCNTLDKLPQPQKCVTCDSLNDVNCAINAHQVGSVERCNSLPYPSCHTSIASDGSTQRGCLANLPADDFVSCLLSGGDKCSHCLGDVCNRETFPASRLQCYSCDSEIDPDCEDMPTKLSVCPYIRESEKCVTALAGNQTERGCSSQVLCDTTDKSTCRHCTARGCNTLNLIDGDKDGNHGMWQELPLKCHNCTGAECVNSLGPAIVCKDGDQQDCMTVFDEEGIVVRRGCTFDVEDDKDHYCRQNSDRCISCKSNECNDAWELNEFETCAYCNSETDASCVTRPANGTFATRKCQKGCMAASFTAANGTTQVIRTCLNDKEIQDQYQCSGEFESNSDCSSCTGEKCNLFNYPKDRLGCNVCVGSSCSSTAAEYCASYVNDDKCYAKYENNKVELSGCLSDVDELTLQEWRENNQLYDCSGENCNAPGELPTAKHCVACNSRENVECATHPSNVNGTQICYAPVNSCMMTIKNTVTQRGCLNSLAYDDQSVCGSGSGLCEKCLGDNCNSKIYPSDRRSCYICQSDKDDNCVKDPTAISVCPNYSQDNQCVTYFDGKITKRACTTELICNVTDIDHCQICNEDSCNTVQLDGVGTIFANNILLTLLVAIVGLRSVTTHCI